MWPRWNGCVLQDARLLNDLMLRCNAMGLATGLVLPVDRATMVFQDLAVKAAVRSYHRRLDGVASVETTRRCFAGA